DAQPLVQKRHLLQPSGDRLHTEVGALEDVPVGPERRDRATLLGGTGFDEFAGLRVIVVLGPHFAVTMYLDIERCRKRVHHGHADAVQPTGYGVRVTVELAARVQHRVDHLDRGPLLLGVCVDGDATTVVGDPHTTVGEQGHLDPARVPGHRLVDRVVHNLRHQMVQTAFTGGTDVHPGAFTNRFEPLENSDG